MAHRRFAKLQRYFLTGLVALLPTALTLFLFIQVVLFIEDLVGRVASRVVGGILGTLFPKLTVPAGGYPGLGIVATLALVVIVGVLLASWVGQRLFQAAERAFSRLPIVRVVYPNVKQVTDFVFSKHRFASLRVVSLEYPSKGIYSIGFVTAETAPAGAGGNGNACVTVFIPSSPTPFTGYAVVVPAASVRPLAMSADEAMRFIISGGVLQGQPVPELPVASEEAVPAPRAGPA